MARTLQVVSAPAPVIHRGVELIAPLHVDDLRFLEFITGKRGIYRVASIRQEVLGLGYSFESVRTGKRVFVYDRDITRDPNGVFIVSDGLFEGND